MEPKLTTKYPGRSQSVASVIEENEQLESQTSLTVTVAADILC